MAASTEQATEFDRLRAAHDDFVAAYAAAHRAAAGKVFARPVADAHLRRGTRALRDTYALARATTFTGEQERAWLDRESTALEKLESTFASRWTPTKIVGRVTTVFGLPG